MGVQRFNVTLSEEVVGEAKKIAAAYGGQLSPILNLLLKEWVEKEKAKRVKLGGKNK